MADRRSKPTIASPPLFFRGSFEPLRKIGFTHRMCQNVRKEQIYEISEHQVCQVSRNAPHMSRREKRKIYDFGRIFIIMENVTTMVSLVSK
jgi:hypothetical protein